MILVSRGMFSAIKNPMMASKYKYYVFKDVNTKIFGNITTKSPARAARYAHYTTSKWHLWSYQYDLNNIITIIDWEKIM